MEAWAVLLTGCVLLTGWTPVVPALGWTAAGSSHFELLAHTPPDQAGALLEHLERAAAVIEGRGAGTLAGRKLRLIVFATDAEYAPYRLAPYASAHYSTFNGEEIIYASRPDRRLLTHELVHAMHRGAAPGPLWWEEGLAEYFSTLRFEGDWAYVGEPIRSRVAALRREGIASLEELRADPPAAQHALAFYRSSWAMVHALMSSGVTVPPPEERWAEIRAAVAARARRGKWPSSRVYSSLQTPLANSASAAMAPNVAQAGSFATLRSSGQALRGLPSAK